jgi:hypothetical protein
MRDIAKTVQAVVPVQGLFRRLLMHGNIKVRASLLSPARPNSVAAFCAALLPGSSSAVGNIRWVCSGARSGHSSPETNACHAWQTHWCGTAAHRNSIVCRRCRKDARRLGRIQAHGSLQRWCVLRIAESGIKYNLRFTAHSADGDGGTLSCRIASRREDDPAIAFFSKLGKSPPQQFIAYPLSRRMNRLAILRRVLIVLGEQRCGVVCVQDVAEPLRVFAEIALGVGLNLRDNRLSDGLFTGIWQRLYLFEPHWIAYYARQHPAGALSTFPLHRNRHAVNADWPGTSQPARRQVIIRSYLSPSPQLSIAIAYCSDHRHRRASTAFCGQQRNRGTHPKIARSMDTDGSSRIDASLWNCAQSCLGCCGCMRRICCSATNRAIWPHC